MLLGINWTWQENLPTMGGRLHKDGIIGFLRYLELSQDVVIDFYIMDLLDSALG